MSERPSPDVSQTYMEQEEVITERGRAYRELAEHHEAERRDLIIALEAACGFLLNAKIDLETGAPKKTAIATIEGGIRVVRAALSRASEKER